MSEKRQPRFQVRVVYLLFVMGGFMLGLGFASWAIPDDPAVVQAAGTAAVGLLVVLFAGVSARDEDEPTSAE